MGVRVSPRALTPLRHSQSKSQNRQSPSETGSARCRARRGLQGVQPGCLINRCQPMSRRGPSCSNTCSNASRGARNHSRIGQRGRRWARSAAAISRKSNGDFYPYTDRLWRRRRGIVPEVVRVSLLNDRRFRMTRPISRTFIDSAVGKALPGPLSNPSGMSGYGRNRPRTPRCPPCSHPESVGYSGSATGRPRTSACPSSLP